MQITNGQVEIVGTVACERTYEALGKRRSAIVMPMMTDHDFYLQEVLLPDAIPSGVLTRGLVVRLPVTVSALDSAVFMRVRDDEEALRFIQRELNITLPPRRRGVR